LRAAVNAMLNESGSSARIAYEHFKVTLPSLFIGRLSIHRLVSFRTRGATRVAGRRMKDTRKHGS